MHDSFLHFIGFDMSSKKRKDALPPNSAAEAAQKSSRNIDEESDHATMRIQRDESQAKLAAALLEIERLKNGRDAELAAALIEIGRLRAAASEPCARCHFYSDWTVRVRTMSGQVHTIACPDGPKTLVAHVKQKLAQFDPKCHILQQVTLVLPCEASSSSSSADPTDPALADDRMLASYGLSKSDMIELLLADMNWSDECLQMIKFLKDCEEKVHFSIVIDDDLALAVSWALVNSINPDLSTLTFDDESISAAGASKICSTLCALSTTECPLAGPRINKLAFVRNEIGDAGTNSCSELLRISAWLKELILYRCGISSVGAVSLGSALRSSASSQLEILDISENNIGLDGVKSIGAALSVNTSLKNLFMIECQVDSAGVHALAEALKVNSSLRKLYIDNNGISTVGAAFFADALQVNSSLRSLSLGTNKIGDDGAALLSAALRVNSTLEDITLDSNQIGDRGATSLSSVLRVNTSLQSLDLGSNQIGDPGAIALGIALVNSSLVSIDLDYNEIGDAGAIAIGEALCSNSALTTIFLIGNKFGALGAASIGKAQRENPRLGPIRLVSYFEST